MASLSPSQEREGQRLVNLWASDPGSFGKLAPEQQTLLKSWLVYNREKLPPEWKSVPDPANWERTNEFKGWYSKYGPTTSTGAAFRKGLAKGATAGFWSGGVGETAGTPKQQVAETFGDLAGMLAPLLLTGGFGAPALGARLGLGAANPIIARAVTEGAMGAVYGGLRGAGEAYTEGEPISAGTIGKQAALNALFWGTGGALMGRNVPRKLAESLGRIPTAPGQVEALRRLQELAAGGGRKLPKHIDFPLAGREGLYRLPLGHDFREGPAQLGRVLKILEGAQRLPRAVPGFKAPAERWLEHKDELFKLLSEVPGGTRAAQATAGATTQAIPRATAATAVQQSLGLGGGLVYLPSGVKAVERSLTNAVAFGGQVYPVEGVTPTEIWIKIGGKFRPIDKRMNAELHERLVQKYLAPEPPASP